MSGPAVLVIGAGALGLASAWHLHERGVTDITVVDGAYPAAKSSGLSVGIVQTQHLRKIDIDMRVVSRRFLDRLERDHDLEVQRTGYLRLGFSSADLAVFEASVEMQRQHGITHPRVLTPAQVADLVPEMNTDDVVGGLFGPNDGYIDGHIYCGIMVAHLASHGVPVRSQSQVVRADRVPDGRHRVTTTRTPTRWTTSSTRPAPGPQMLLACSVKPSPYVLNDIKRSWCAWANRWPTRCPAS